ncbi:alpha subunit of casein kinase [Purpureocillium lavendulum]|uniref:Alpha subunit of casein kinase n=1 Tax=Purpureocillium lavendulum TaxID=1247861 RepID=A0AB34FTX3_9HYPO|nr:alpha subunit of casein kinase [Purpureocillium lavendulum]
MGKTNNERSDSHLQYQIIQEPPVPDHLLGEWTNDGVPGTRSRLFLPASCRTLLGDLSVPVMDIAFLERELSLERLHCIERWLWMAGRPMPPRPLHHQRLLGREIVITESMDMHLVWSKRRILVKPIPRFLLDKGFWQTVLRCQHLPDSFQTPADTNYGRSGYERRRQLWRIAHGFLFSYAALVAYESDLDIAKSIGLVPAHIEWPAWQGLVRHVLHVEGENSILQSIDERFVYGELRLGRLNKIYRITQGGSAVVRGYLSEWATYGDFFNDNLAWLAGAVAYIAIVLTAMQVGLGTNCLKDDNAFHAASYGFTVFSILGPLVVVLVVFVAFCLAFVSNWVSAVAYKRKRLGEVRSRAQLPYNRS